MKQQASHFLLIGAGQLADRTSSSGITDLHLARPAGTARVNAILDEGISRQFLPLLARPRPRHSPPPTSRRTPLRALPSACASWTFTSVRPCFPFVSSRATAPSSSILIYPRLEICTCLYHTRVSHPGVSSRTPPYSVIFSYVGVSLRRHARFFSLSV